MLSNLDTVQSSAVAATIFAERRVEYSRPRGEPCQLGLCHLGD
jgi:hypothetical protein